jgi:hypothetical protein
MNELIEQVLQGELSQEEFDSKIYESLTKN